MLAACTGEAVEPITIDLSGSQWQLVDMNGTQPVPDRVPTLHFVDESNLAGWTGCNDYEGGYELVGTAFTPGIIFSNLMACVQEDVMAQQRSYLQILGDATRLTLANDTLTIQGDAGTLVFEPVPEQEVGLAGTEWQLASINGSSPIEGTDATLRFEEDGIMGGSTGCNQYGGSYRASGDNLTVTEMAWTEMACLEPEGIMEQESEFTRILSSAHGFDLTGSVLEIYADGGYLVFEPLHTDIEEEPMVDLPYVRWQLATINGENPLPDTRVTLIFENDTTLSGSGGCNGYDGTYAIDGEGFTTGDIVRTLMACAEPEGIMEKEDAVLAILQSAKRFS
ncbi:MAG: META domain-containing protein [Anaerolineae bacterium]